MLRFYRVEVDFDEGRFGGLGSARLIRLAERLVCYPGIVNQRAQQEQRRGPSGAALAAGAEVIESSPAVLTTNAATAGAISFARVPG